MSFSNLIYSRLVTYCVEQSKAYEYRMTDLWMDALKSQKLLRGHKRTFVRQSDGETITTKNLNFTNISNQNKVQQYQLYNVRSVKKIPSTVVIHYCAWYIFLRNRHQMRCNWQIKDHPFKTSACLRGEGCPHVQMVKRSQYIRIKNPLHKHFAGMPMVGGMGQKS